MFYVLSATKLKDSYEIYITILHEDPEKTSCNYVNDEIDDVIWKFDQRSIEMGFACSSKNHLSGSTLTDQGRIELVEILSQPSKLVSVEGSYQDQFHSYVVSTTNFTKAWDALVR